MAGRNTAVFGIYSDRESVEDGIQALRAADQFARTHGHGAEFGIHPSDRREERRRARRSGLDAFGKAANRCGDRLDHQRGQRPDADDQCQ